MDGITNKALLYLVSCAINAEVPDKNTVAKMDLEAVYSLASRHMITAIVATAIEATGYKDERSGKAIASSLRKITFFELEKEALLKKLESSGIWYMLLKGAVLKNFYPKKFMREMSDYDILFDSSRAKDVKKIMQSLGFSVISTGVQNEDVYSKPPLVFFEMHRTLFGARHGNAINNYYRDVKQRLIKDIDNNFGFHFTQEDFYIYTISHEYTHYSTAGIGLRSLLDVYVYLKKHVLDWDYINNETEKLRISDFEKQNRQLALSLFNAQEITAEGEKMLQYIISSGAYGTKENYIKNDMGKTGHLEYFFKRLTLPYSQMIEEYPVLQKAPILYPFCWLSRLLIRGLILRRKKFLYQLKTIMKKKEK